MNNKCAVRSLVKTVADNDVSIVWSPLLSQSWAQLIVPHVRKIFSKHPQYPLLIKFLVLKFIHSSPIPNQTGRAYLIIVLFLITSGETLTASLSKASLFQLKRSQCKLTEVISYTSKRKHEHVQAGKLELITDLHFNPDIWLINVLTYLKKRNNRMWDCVKFRYRKILWAVKMMVKM